MGRNGSLSLGDREIDALCKDIVDAAIAVHRQLGPGLLESVYEIFLMQELEKRGLKTKRQVSIPVQIGDMTINTAFRADLIVENTVLIELKAVEQLIPVHKAQVISYLKLTQLPVAFLMNFNSILLKDGLRRFTNK